MPLLHRDRSAALALLLLALSTHALARPALLPNPDIAGSGPSAAVTAPATPPAVTAAMAPAPPVVTQLLVGAGAAVVSVPVGLLLGTAIGGISNNLLGAALPSLLLFAALPPLAVTWAEWLTGNWASPGSVRFQPAIWVALGVHLLATAGAIYFGVWSMNLQAVALLTVIEAVLLPGAVTGTMWLTRPVPEPQPRVARFEPPSFLEATPGHAAPPRSTPAVPLAAFAF